VEGDLVLKKGKIYMPKDKELKDKDNPVTS